MDAEKRCFNDVGKIDTKAQSFKNFIALFGAKTRPCPRQAKSVRNFTKFVPRNFDY